MKPRNYLLILMAFWFAIGLFLSAPGEVPAACDWEPDGPTCPCFSDAGAWDPEGLFIQDVALQTVGTEESCKCPGEPACDWAPLDDSGKPYYQMVLGCNNANCARFVSWALWTFGPIYDQREWWCSETVSYWHRETGIPYSRGYATGWHVDWQVHGVGALRTWYITEESADGRGRWLPEYLVDYEDFELGVTVPVPGAYVAIRRYDDVNAGWYVGNQAGTHSLMVNEMWVHLDGSGNVFRVAVSLLEGNSGERVKDEHYWNDVWSLTTAGPDWIGTSKKIYGFGIDLNAAGEPIYDPDRLHYVLHPYAMASPLIVPVEADDSEWDSYFVKFVKPLQSYAKQLRAAHGPKVECSSNLLKIYAIPDGTGTSWHFPKGFQEAVEVEIDLLQAHPLPISGLLMIWDSTFLPVGTSVRFAGANHEYRDASMLDMSEMDPPMQTASIAVPVKFGSGSESVRYVKFIFPKGIFKESATLEELRFRYREDLWEDSKDNPVQTNVCPADLDRDADVDGMNASEFAFAYLKKWPLADVDGNGTVNAKDFVLFVDGFGQTDCVQVIK